MAKKDLVTKAEDALVKAHRSHTWAEPDNLWNMQVMAQVRGLKRVCNGDNDPVVAQRFVWRFAAAVCTLAVIISLYAFSLGIRPEQLALKLFIEDPLNALTMRVVTL